MAVFFFLFQSHTLYLYIIRLDDLYAGTVLIIMNALPGIELNSMGIPPFYTYFIYNVFNIEIIIFSYDVSFF